MIGVPEEVVSCVCALGTTCMYCLHLHTRVQFRQSIRLSLLKFIAPERRVLHAICMIDKLVVILWKLVAGRKGFKTTGIVPIAHSR